MTRCLGLFLVAFMPSIFLLVIRLMQTVMLMSFAKPSVQAAFASMVGLLAAILQRELKPYRRPRDDAVALASQIVIYVWCIALLLVRVGVLQIDSHARVSIIGLALVAITLALGGFALGLTAEDLVDETQEKRAEDAEIRQSELREEEAKVAEDIRQGRTRRTRISAVVQFTSRAPQNQSTDDSAITVFDEITEISGTNPMREHSAPSVSTV